MRINPRMELKPLQMGTRMLVLNESFPMKYQHDRITMIFVTFLSSCALCESSLSRESVNSSVIFKTVMYGFVRDKYSQ